MKISKSELKVKKKKKHTVNNNNIQNKDEFETKGGYIGTVFEEEDYKEQEYQFNDDKEINYNEMNENNMFNQNQEDGNDYYEEDFQKIDIGDNPIVSLMKGIIFLKFNIYKYNTNIKINLF